MTKQQVTQPSDASSAKNISKDTPKNRKKTWLILGIILGVLLLPLVILDIRYRIEFAEFEAEQKFIVSLLPKGTVKDTSRPDYIRGNGLLGRLHCYVLGLGKPCPIVSRHYYLPIDHDEMEVARTALTKAGYEIESGDLPGTPGGECSIPDKKSCWAQGYKGKYSGWISIGQNQQDLSEPINYIVHVEPNHLYKK